MRCVWGGGKLLIKIRSHLKKVYAYSMTTFSDSDEITGNELETV